MNILISFPDQSKSFTYGVEFGRLLEKIERGDEVIKNNGFPIRIENLEILKKMLPINNYIGIFGEPYMDGWVDFLGIKNKCSDN